MERGCPEEYPISLFLNGYEVAVFQLTNQDLEDWTYGYLFSEGMIQTPEDIQSIYIDDKNSFIRVTLNFDYDPEQFSDKKKHYTAGCGRGVTFFSMTDVKSFNRVDADVSYGLSYLLKKQSQFAQNSPIYLETGGMHGACIVEPDGTITVREDIGRHNAVDKIIGHAFKNKLKANDLVLLTTGRISYEMLSKSAKFGFPVVGSRTAATKQAIQLAKFLNVEVIGYLRGKKAIQYTSAGRIENDLRQFVLESTV